MRGNEQIRHTTILSVRREGKVVLGGDGQVSIGETIFKDGARKIRALDDGKILCGFAGSAADALALLERFEGKTKKHPGNLRRAATELAKEWRLDKALRQLQSLLAVVDGRTSLIISGSGDVLEPDDGIIGLGSGGQYAAAAARALLAHSDLDAEAIVREALKIAASICVYTNDRLSLLSIEEA